MRIMCSKTDASEYREYINIHCNYVIMYFTVKAVVDFLHTRMTINSKLQGSEEKCLHTVSFQINKLKSLFRGHVSIFPTPEEHLVDQ